MKTNLTSTSWFLATLSVVALFSGCMSASAHRAAVEDATTDQVIVVTVDSLQGDEIEDYANQLLRKWAIGQSGQVKASNGQTYKDNGVILLIAPNERKVRIEVGYGLEPVMTDAMSSIIIRHDILPQFKSGA